MTLHAQQHRPSATHAGCCLEHAALVFRLERPELVDCQQVQVHSLVGVRVVEAAEQQEVFGGIAMLDRHPRIAPGPCVAGGNVVRYLAQKDRASGQLRLEQVDVAERAPPTRADPDLQPLLGRHPSLTSHDVLHLPDYDDGV